MSGQVSLFENYIIDTQDNKKYFGKLLPKIKNTTIYTTNNYKLFWKTLYFILKNYKI